MLGSGFSHMHSHAGTPRTQDKPGISTKKSKGPKPQSHRTGQVVHELQDHNPVEVSFWDRSQKVVMVVWGNSVNTPPTFFSK